MKLVNEVAIETGLVPKDITGAAQTGDYVSLKDYRHLTIILQQGAWAGGTPAVTLFQATDVAATGEKALSFSKRYTQVGLTGTGYTETAVASDTFNLPNVANTINVIEIDAEDLDVDNGFDCVCVKVASPGANADLLSIQYILSEPRFQGAAMPDPKVD